MTDANSSTFEIVGNLMPRSRELRYEVKTDSGLMGKIFVHGRNVTEGTQLNGLDIERYRYEGVALEGHVHADGISIDGGRLRS